MDYSSTNHIKATFNLSVNQNLKVNLTLILPVSRRIDFYCFVFKSHSQISLPDSSLITNKLNLARTRQRFNFEI